MDKRKIYAWGDGRFCKLADIKEENVKEHEILRTKILPTIFTKLKNKEFLEMLNRSFSSDSDNSHQYSPQKLGNL